MRNTKEIRHALELYMAKNGLACRDFAIKINIRESSIARWRNGESKTIRNSHWAIIEPLLKPYLPENFGTEEAIELVKPKGFKKLENLINSLSPSKLQELENMINKAALSLREEILKKL